MIENQLQKELKTLESRLSFSKLIQVTVWQFSNSFLKILNYNPQFF